MLRPFVRPNQAPVDSDLSWHKLGSSSRRRNDTSLYIVLLNSMAGNAKLFLGGISPATTAEMIAEHFSQYGTVVHAEHVLTPDGKTRGFGFVSFKDAREANAALTGLDGTVLDGRAIQVNIAQDNGRDLGTDDRE